MRVKTATTFLATVFLFFAASSIRAQEPALPAPAMDPIEQLRLTPEQRQRIRMIFEANKDERQLTNRRVREANVALDQALDADPINESVIEQRTTELATAQTAQVRMRIQTEVKIRRELRAEQLATLRALRLQVRDVMSPQGAIKRRPLRQNLRPRNR